MKILVVDDNRDDRRVLRYTIEAHGHTALVAGDGQEGLAMAHAHRPDLIISDVLMPGMDGFHFLRNIQQIENLRSIPFVFYSAVYGGDQDVQLATSMGADAYIIKPLEPAALWDEVEKVIGAGKRGRIGPAGLIEADADYLKRYSQVVASKLEEKVRELEETLAERTRADEALRVKQQQLTAMTLELSLAEERERLRIASVLHDHIGQILLLGKMRLDMLADAPLPEPTAKVIAEVSDLLDQAIRDAHSLTVELNPPMLAGAGLEAALEWLGRRMASDYGLDVEFEDDQQEKALSDEFRSVLYQSARELLINVAKHADTDRARLVVRRKDGMYSLAVEDRGAGFDLAALAPERGKECGFGLFSIQIKIERLGGKVILESAPGHGTSVTILVPLKCPADT